MSRHAVYTDAPDGSGSDRVYLDDLGVVSGLRWQTSSRGDLAAQWTLQMDTRARHRALTAGRFITLPIGARGWRGFLGNPLPAPGDTWQMTAAGLPSLGKNYDAIASGGNALNLNQSVDGAIARGLPWTRPASLVTTEGTLGSGAATVYDVLDQVSDAEGRLWRVDRSGAVSTPSRPTNVAYLLAAGGDAGGRTVTGFVTDVDVTYINSATYAQTTLTRSAASRPFGRSEQPLDVTDRGAISTAKAQAIGDNYLLKNGPRLRFTAPFTVAAGQLVTPGGVEVDLATVEATDGLIQVTLTDPDIASGELAYTPVQMVVGQTDYDDDADVLTVTPYDFTPVGLPAVFAA